MSWRCILLLLLALSTFGCSHDWDREWRGVDDAAAPPVDAKVSPPPPPPPPPPGSFVRLLPGRFSMGSPKDEPCRGNEPLRTVILTRCFDMMATEVTRAEYAELFVDRLPDPEPDENRCEDKQRCPVRNVSWHQAANYCNELSKKRGLEPCYECTVDGTHCARSDKGHLHLQDCLGYRLPTEAEWEYAYRAGTRTSLYNGELESCDAADAIAEEIAWYEQNADNRPQPRATRSPNDWGLYDMAGNVYEWCQDRYSPEVSGAGVINPVVEHDPEIPLGTLRGGAYLSKAAQLRAAARAKSPYDTPLPQVGFRCVRTPVLKQFVIKSLQLPDKQNDRALDLDDSGIKKNNLGALLAFVTPLIDLQVEMDRILQQGKQIGLLELYADSENDAQAVLQLHSGQDYDNDNNNNFSGKGQFTPLKPTKDSDSSSVLPANTSLDKIEAGPGTVTLPIPALGDPVQLHRARLILERVGNEYRGLVGGAMTMANVEAQLLPAVADRLTLLLREAIAKFLRIQVMHLHSFVLTDEEKGWLEEARQAYTLISSFDENGNNIIETKELKDSVIYEILNAQIAIASEPGGEKDAIPIGLGITVVPCIIYHVFE